MRGLMEVLFRHTRVAASHSGGLSQASCASLFIVFHLLYNLLSSSRQKDSLDLLPHKTIACWMHACTCPISALDRESDISTGWVFFYSNSPRTTIKAKEPEGSLAGRASVVDSAVPTRVQLQQKV